MIGIDKVVAGACRRSTRGGGWLTRGFRWSRPGSTTTYDYGTCQRRHDGVSDPISHRAAIRQHLTGEIAEGSLRKCLWLLDLVDHAVSAIQVGRDPCRQRRHRSLIAKNAIAQVLEVRRVLD